MSNNRRDQLASMQQGGNRMQRLDNSQTHVRKSLPARKLDLSKQGLHSLDTNQASAFFEEEAKVLVVSNNRLVSLAGINLLQPHEFLQEVHARQNLLRDVSALSYFPNLRIVDLSHNHLEALPDVSSATCLKALNLAHNNITSLEEASLMLPPSLHTLDVSHCPIPLACHLKFLSHLAALTRLNFLETTFYQEAQTQGANVLLAACFLLPKVTHLNGRMADPAMKKSAQMIFTDATGRIASSRLALLDEDRNEQLMTLLSSSNVGIDARLDASAKGRGRESNATIKAHPAKATTTSPGTATLANQLAMLKSRAQHSLLTEEMSMAPQEAPVGNTANSDYMSYNGISHADENAPPLAMSQAAVPKSRISAPDSKMTENFAEGGMQDRLARLEQLVVAQREAIATMWERQRRPLWMDVALFNRAATTIQCVWRGYVDRQIACVMRMHKRRKDAFRHAAFTIQKCFKAWRLREVGAARLRWASACILQSCVRRQSNMKSSVSLTGRLLGLIVLLGADVGELQEYLAEDDSQLAGGP